MSEGSGGLKGYRGDGVRFGQLLALLGVTGFAISQPLLSIAGENPSIFVYAGVRGSGIVMFALLVALVPPLVMWAVIVAVGAVNRRVGDLVFVGATSLLVAVTVIQWIKSAGVERWWLLGLIGLAAAVGFGYVMTYVDVVAAWTRLTSPLPAFAVVLLLLSPTGQLVKSQTTVVADATAGADTPSVVVIMLDELPLQSMLAPDGTIDNVRFPNMAGLAEHSTWYPNYTIMANATLYSIPSILTGTKPKPGSPLWTSHPNSIFSLFAPTHDLVATEIGTQICGYTNCGLDSGVSERAEPGMKKVLSQMTDVWRQRVSLGPVDPVDFGQFRDDEDLVPAEVSVKGGDLKGTAEEQAVSRPGPVNDFIDSIDPDDPRSLRYLHIMLPHQPWMFYPDGQPFGGLSPYWLMPDPENPDPWIMSELQQGHLFQAEYADRLVGEVIDRLHETDQFEDSVVVVTADHGVGFKHFPNMRTIDDDTTQSVAYVPLVIKSPGQSQGKIDESNLMGVDLLPTIADLVGMDIDWNIDGYAAGSPEIEERGDRKDFYLFDLLAGRLTETIEFDASEHRPKASDRLVGPIGPGDNPVKGLISLLGAEGYLDRSVSALDVDEDDTSTARVRDLEKFLEPPKVMVARIVGKVDDVSAGRTVLVAFNGTVASAAPVDDDGAFQTLLPPDIQDPAGNEVSLYQVADDGTIAELDLS